MLVTLDIVAGPEQGRTFTFTEPDTFLIGRSSKAHLNFDYRADRLISRHHCVLHIRGGRCILSDLFSTNGTMVNGERITQTDIRDGDEIRIGRSVIRVAIQPDPEDEVEPAAEARPAAPAAEQPVVIDLRSLVDSDEVRLTPEFRCHGCGTDLTERANADGLARELAVSLYLCPSCTKSRREGPTPIDGLGLYTPLAVLGQGAMGVVYQAVHTVTRRVVAIKTLAPSWAKGGLAVRLFEREINVQSRVISPNLVRVLNWGRIGRLPYLVTEYLSGGSARDAVLEVHKGPLPMDLACRLSIQMLTGLKVLHDRGFIHRDLKPSNCLLDRDHRNPEAVLKIGDYGLAKSFEEAGHSLMDFTQTGDVAGSLPFIPPEQITMYKYLKTTADVYGAGATLYFMLTARYTTDFPEDMPLTRNVTFSTEERHPLSIVLEEPSVPIRWRSPDVPEALAAVVDRAVDKDAGRRYPAAAAFLDDLRRVVRELGWAS